MPKYLTTNEAAERLRIAPQTLRVWRLRGIGPKFTKPTASRVRYSEAEIERFMEARTYQSTAEETTARKGRGVAA